MLAKRIIPCLDVKDGFVVKGQQYQNLRIEGKPAELAEKYEEQGADELVFLDICATAEKRKIRKNMVKEVAKKISIPFTVGGGLKSIDEIQDILCSGADKISINSAAIKNPELIAEASELFGKQCIVVAIDTKRKTTTTNISDWEVFIEGGRINTKINPIKWAIKVKKLGAGELLPTSMDQDGMKSGYDIELIKILSEITNLPIIASGGAGSLEHIYDVLTEGKADAALAASIFHRDSYSVSDVKEFLRDRGLTVRL